MAIISRIRSYGVISLVVGIVVLLLFVLQAMLTGGTGFSLFGSTPVGEINGETIDESTWQNALQRQSKLFSYKNSQDHGLENDVWTNLVETSILQTEYDALGLVISDEELDEIMFGNFISPYVLSTFYGGKDSLPFHEQLRTNFDEMDKQDAEGYKDLIKMKRLRQKYDGLVSKGGYVNSLDAKYAFNQANNKANIVYVVKPYAEIPEGEITWTEEDIENYYNEHKNDRNFKQERSRTLAYVLIPIAASSKDSADVLASISNLTSEFAASKTASADSLYAVTHSSVQGTGKVKYTPGSFPEPFNSQMINDSIGKVIGPVFAGGTAKLAKVTFRGSEVDSVTARHILLTEKGDIGKAKADSLKKEIIAKKNFAELATKFSKDPGSAAKGGDLPTFGKGAMVPEFENACFNGKVGDLQIVESQFGTHLIEITKKGAPTAVTYYASVEKEMVPSGSTRKETQRTAIQFIQEHSDSVSFRKGAIDKYGGLTTAPNVRPEAVSISGIQSASEIVSWSYSTDIEEGKISQPFLTDNGWVIACVMEVKEQGVPSLRNAYDKVKKEVIKKKKAEKYKSIMTGGSMEEIAGKIGGTAKQAENLTMNMSNIPGSGINEQENAVVGVCFGLPTGNISSPIEGKGGIYVIQRSGDLALTSSVDNYATEKKRLTENARRGASFLIFNSFKEAAEITDNRFVPRN
jgi:peptidyl-prolyl cis-trans isomerase D